jgi:hypothetical protein
MKYTKPEVDVLGTAVNVIESHVKGSGVPDQAPLTGIVAAYDLDE